jgi:hypothetical protein
MKHFFFILTFCLLVFPLFAQDHILIDCIHGASFTTSYEGPVPIDFQTIFPGDVLTIITPDSLQGLVTLEDTDISAGSYTYFFNLPSIGIPEEVQTLYVIAHDNSGNILNGILGTILNPEYEIVGNLFNGSGHVDAAYGDAWHLQIQTPSDAHLFVGYGSTVFSAPAQYGHYDVSNYDAVLRIYDQYYLAYMSECPDYSPTDLSAISEGLQNGLSFMHIFNYLNTIVDKPFIHMYTPTNMAASVKVTVPGTRTLAKPKPTGNGQEFGWKDIHLVPGLPNEHVYETSLNQGLNFIVFNLSSSSVEIQNQTDVPLKDLILIKNSDPRHYQIGIMETVQPFVRSNIENWKSFSTEQARDFLQNELFVQCLACGLTQQEARHFSYELPWIDVLLLRAVKFPDQYFGLYRFDNDLYDRLIPVDISPKPAVTERNMWVMLSNIQPRETLPTIPLGPILLPFTNSNNKENYVYREYGIADERYSMRNSVREIGFYGIDIYSQNMFHSTLPFYTNTFANELAGYAESNMFPYWLTSFIETSPEQFGIFYDILDNLHPMALAKPILNQGRVMVLGSSSQFGDVTQYAFLNSAMNSLIHSPNLITGNIPPVPINHVNVEISNFPNPFNPETTIQFSIPAKGKVDISLYNIKGQLIKRLLSKDMEGGKHTVQWNGNNQNQEQTASQVILCRLHYKGNDYTKKIVLMK